LSYTLAQLRGLVAVAEEGHFGRAAERLWMTQPPLSRRIKKLEEEVGVDLFERTPHAVVLTPAGRTFLGEARKILSLADSAPLLAKRVATGDAGTIRIGFTAMSALSVLGSWINVAAAELPEVDIQLFELVTRHQVDALLAGNIDVGLARGVPLSDILAAKLIHSERLMLAAPIGHPLLTLERAVTLRDITAYDVVTYSPTESAYLYQLVVSAFGRFKTQPRYVQYVQQVNSVLATVNAGLGVALVPHTASVLQLGNVEFRDIDDVQDFPVEVHCIWRRSHDNPALAAFLRRLEIEAEDEPAPA
jgi:Transcriptional regulator